MGDEILKVGVIDKKKECFEINKSRNNLASNKS